METNEILFRGEYWVLTYASDGNVYTITAFDNKDSALEMQYRLESLSHTCKLVDSLKSLLKCIWDSELTIEHFNVKTNLSNGYSTLIRN